MSTESDAYQQQNTARSTLDGIGGILLNKLTIYKQAKA
jgi:hypothetical protein